MRSGRGLAPGLQRWVRGGRLAPLGRWAWRSLQMPHRLTEMTQHVRGMDAALAEISRLLRANAGGAGAVAAPLQSYPGYRDADLALFERFAPAPPPSGASGFITNFLGVRTRTSFVQGTEGLSGKVLGLPVPDDGWHSEAVEWIGLLKSVAAARGRLTMMELGAGWGAWSVAAAAAARVTGVTAHHDEQRQLESGGHPLLLGSGQDRQGFLLPGFAAPWNPPGQNRAKPSAFDALAPHGANRCGLTACQIGLHIIHGKFCRSLGVQQPSRTVGRRIRISPNLSRAMKQSGA